MNQDRSPCQSCGMPIEAGPYCQYCIDESGNLQTFEERFARWLADVARNDPRAA